MLSVLKIYSTRNVHCKFLVLLMVVAEKEDRERERETEIANLKAFIKSLQNELAIAKTSAQIPRSEVPATSSKSEVPATLQLQNLRCLHHQSYNHLYLQSCKDVSSSNFTV